MSAYHGPDRRGIIGRPDRRATYRTAVWILAAVAGVPLLFVGITGEMAGRSFIRVWSLRAGDAAFVAFVVVSVLLALRWRLIGEAASISFLAASSLIGLLIVPATTDLAFRPSAYLDSVRTAAVVLVIILSIDAARAPDVRSDAKPARLLVGVSTLAFVAAVPLTVSPLQDLIEDRRFGFQTSEMVEAVACGAVAVLLIRSGVRRRRMLRLGFGVSLISLGAACAVLSFAPAGSSSPWSVLPDWSLFTAALALLGVLGRDARAVIGTVVLQDLRGRRRWEAAETELTEMRRGYQGQRHDVRSVLSAVDGTLLVLSRYRDHFSEEHTARLISALREQIRFLQEMFGGAGGPRSYDLSELLGAIVSVRSAGGRPVGRDIEPEIEVHGHPDRLAVIIHDLLANAATHAPGADVTVRAARIPDGPLGETVEICVADEGPGIPDTEMVRATERGWRGRTGAGRPGSGLGLYQCREIAQAEGASFTLEPTNPLGPAAKRGLTARIRIPLYRPQESAATVGPSAASDPAPTGGLPLRSSTRSASAGIPSWPGRRGR